MGLGARGGLRAAASLLFTVALVVSGTPVAAHHFVVGPAGAPTVQPMGADPSAATAPTAADGPITWSTRVHGFASARWRSVTWSPELGLFVAVDGTQGRGKVMTSPDGANWTIAAETSSHWYDVVWSAELGIFVAVGYSFTDQREVMTSSDGVNWTLRDTPSNAFHFWFS